MSKLTGNCIVGQSGGPTAVINSSLAGVIRQASQSKLIDKVFGAVHGVEGILKKDIVDLKNLIKTEQDIKLLKTTPAAYLGSCRYKLPDVSKQYNEYKKLFEIFSEYNIRYFFYIGGNDSMDTVMKLSEYANIISYPIKVIGIPKTIDNDLMGTDHTPGFGSAAKFVATTIKEIAKDSNVYDLDSVTIIEIMGRNAGWLTASSALARTEYNSSPDLIYLPEMPFSLDKFLEDVKTIMKSKKNVVVSVSEGIRDTSGKYISDFITEEQNDVFGNKSLGGVGKVLESVVKQSLSCKVRSVELNVLQRCCMNIASKTDLDEAYNIGKEGVTAAENGITGKMMIFKRLCKPEYEIVIDSMDIKKIANHEKQIPKEWISKNGNDVTSELVNYIQPLILGEPEITIQNGLPVFLTLKK